MPAGGSSAVNCLPQRECMAQHMGCKTQGWECGTEGGQDMGGGSVLCCDVVLCSLLCYKCCVTSVVLQVLCYKCCVVLCCVVLCCVVLCCVVLCCVVLCCVVLCGVVWCGVWCGVVWCGVLCCVVLCCVVFISSPEVPVT